MSLLLETILAICDKDINGYWLLNKNIWTILVIINKDNVGE